MSEQSKKIRKLPERLDFANFWSILRIGVNFTSEFTVNEDERENGRRYLDEREANLILRLA